MKIRVRRPSDNAELDVDLSDDKSRRELIVFAKKEKIRVTNVEKQKKEDRRG